MPSISLSVLPQSWDFKILKLAQALLKDYNINFCINITGGETFGHQVIAPDTVGQNERHHSN